MSFSIIRSLKISMTIVGTTIGAGFASGREIWEFFSSYGESSQVGIVISMVILWLAGMILMLVSWKKQTSRYSELLAYLMGPFFAKLIDGLILLSLLTTTMVMMAGSGATFEQWFGPSGFFAGCLVMAVAVLIVLLFDVEGLLSINVVLIPVLMAILIYVCFQFLESVDPLSDSVKRGANQPIWPTAIAYTAFNIISLLAVLSTMGKQIKHTGEVWFAGITSTLCLGGLAYIYNNSLLRIEHLISQYEIPLFALVEHISPIWIAVISSVLWLAIYTTAVSSMHGLVFRLSAYMPLPRVVIGFICMIILLPLSQIGFAKLVEVLYPIFGVINLSILASILLYPFIQPTPMGRHYKL
ncbi:hypothetical protein IC619_008325 [Hazenella sp. IB182353]|uniref:YkvI family membrane protein n=1 Tax=Polycladospora coralii TaxID=2771432 RepID=UPI00174664A4|nr:hypothetical protein [Polycladospora coralii]MBS7530494.1 hypothetical protein [Polycladospora coralii]